MDAQKPWLTLHRFLWTYKKTPHSARLLWTLCFEPASMLEQRSHKPHKRILAPASIDASGSCPVKLRSTEKMVNPCCSHLDAHHICMVADHCYHTCGAPNRLAYVSAPPRGPRAYPGSLRSLISLARSRGVMCNHKLGLHHGSVWNGCCGGNLRRSRFADHNGCCSS